MVLMGRGIACEIACDGQEAVDIIKRKGDVFDFIFMDHFMPVMVRKFITFFHFFFPQFHLVNNFPRELVDLTIHPWLFSPLNSVN